MTRDLFALAALALFIMAVAMLAPLVRAVL